MEKLGIFSERSERYKVIDGGLLAFLVSEANVVRNMGHWEMKWWNMVLIEKGKGDKKKELV